MKPSVDTYMHHVYNGHKSVVLSRNGTETAAEAFIYIFHGHISALSGYDKYSVILYSYFILNLGTVRLIKVMSHERFFDCYKNI